MLNLGYHRNVVLLYLQYGIYDSPVPSTFYRSAQSISVFGQPPTPLLSPQTTSSFQLDDCVTIVLTSEIGHGATGIVLHGTMQQTEASSGCGSLEVVVKFAFTHWQREALRHEYEVYRKLRSHRICTGITAPLGLFDDAECGPSIHEPRNAVLPLSTPHRPTFLLTPSFHCQKIRQLIAFNFRISAHNH